MKKKMFPIVHFEMPAKDTKRMSAFYAKALGWETEVMGEEMGNYVVVTTTPNDTNGRPSMPGTINGGFYPVKNDGQAHQPSLVVAVDNIHESMKDVNEAGGKIMGEPAEIPGVGLYVSFTDTEGNVLSLLQPLMTK